MVIIGTAFYICILTPALQSNDPPPPGQRLALSKIRQEDMDIKGIIVISLSSRDLFPAQSPTFSDPNDLPDG